MELHRRCHRMEVNRRGHRLFLPLHNVGVAVQQAFLAVLLFLVDGQALPLIFFGFVHKHIFLYDS